MTGSESAPPMQHGHHAALLTTITTLVSRSGHESFIAQEFERTFALGEEDTHHLATLLIQQEGGVSFLISQFADDEALRRWRDSVRYRRMIDAFEAHSLRELCTIEQPAARILVPSPASGPKWKTLVTSWIVTFPLLLGLVRLLDLLLPRSPLLLRITLTSIIMSVAITWLIAPATQRFTRTWRLKNQQMKILEVPRSPVPGGSPTG